MHGPLLSLHAVEAGYQAEVVLRGVTLEVSPGEAWAVLGPNGAGKSTLARVALGLVTVRSGQVSVCGHPVPGTAPAVLAQEIAWVPQSMADDAGFSALEVVLMGRSPHLGLWGLPRHDDVQLAQACLGELGVAHLAHRPVSEVSGGERRRIWVARGLAQSAKLLVLDEPTAFLDIRHQVELLKAVRRRVDGGMGVLAVLHDVNMAARFATHALLLKDGRALASGRAHDVLNSARLSELYDIEMHSPAAHEPVHLPRWEAP